MCNKIRIKVEWGYRQTSKMSTFIYVVTIVCSYKSYHVSGSEMNTNVQTLSASKA